MAAHQAPPSLGFSRQEHWSGLPFSSPMHESEKWKWSRSVVSDPQRPHGLQPTRILRPWDFPGKSTGVGCHCLLLAGQWDINRSFINACTLEHSPLRMLTLKMIPLWNQLPLCGPSMWRSHVRRTDTPVIGQHWPASYEHASSWERISGPRT